MVTSPRLGLGMVVLEASLDFGADFEGTVGMVRGGADDSACSFSQVSPSALAKWSSTDNPVIESPSLPLCSLSLPDLEDEVFFAKRVR